MTETTSATNIAPQPPTSLTRLTVAFDADDTLWHNEGDFAEIEARFRNLCAPWADPETVDATLIAKERERVKLTGFGPMPFALSMIETLIKLSDSKASSSHFSQIIDWCYELLTVNTPIIEGAIEAVTDTAMQFDVMVITKGDLLHQLRRFNTTPFPNIVRDVEVVAEKDAKSYQRILKRHRIDPKRFVMVGNSMASDVLPVLEIGASAIHIPYEITWELEKASDPKPSSRWFRVEKLGDISDIIEEIAAEVGPLTPATHTALNTATNSTEILGDFNALINNDTTKENR